VTLDGADLSDANMEFVLLLRSTFRGANLTGLQNMKVSIDTDLTDATVNSTTFQQISEAQLTSTRSYQDKDLRDIHFTRDLFHRAVDFLGWNLRGQDLRGAQFGNDLRTRETDLGETDLRGANLRHAFIRTQNFDSLLFDSTTTYDQWTIFREGRGSIPIDPADYGLTFQPTRKGDFDANGQLDASDISGLQAVVGKLHVDGRGWISRSTPLGRFDLVKDRFLNDKDIAAWLLQTGTLVGDANVDGIVDFADFLPLSDGFGGRGGWGDGDFDGDGLLAFADFLLLADDFGNSPTENAIASTAAVAEPHGGPLFLFGVLLLVTWARRQW